MPSARELLEQADALMRRNRSPLMDDIPVLTEAVPEVPPGRPQRPRTLQAQPDTHDTIPMLTDSVPDAGLAASTSATKAAVVEEGEPSDWLQTGGAEPSVIGEAPDSIVIVPALEQEVTEEIDLEAPLDVEEAFDAELAQRAAARPMNESEALRAAMEPAPAAQAASAAVETVAAPVEVLVTSAEDDAVAARMAPPPPPLAPHAPAVQPPAPEASSLSWEEDGTWLEQSGGHALEEDTVAAEEEAPPAQGASAVIEEAVYAHDAPAEAIVPATPAEPAADEARELTVSMPPEHAVEAMPEPVVAVMPEPVVAVMPEPVVAAMPEPVVAVPPEPVAAAPSAAEREAAESARWASMAEEIRMQVLQRIDLFTDTGLRDQLGARLQPIVDRASADLVATINLHVGELLRSYVAEAIEREIENWRSQQR